MKIKTSELTGAALDWAVAMCEGVEPEAARLFHDEGRYNFSTDWSQGGPIIERERLEVVAQMGMRKGSKQSCRAWRRMFIDACKKAGIKYTEGGKEVQE